MLKRISDFMWAKSLQKELKKAGVKAEVRHGPSLADVFHKLADEEAAQDGVQPTHCHVCKQTHYVMCERENCPLRKGD